MIAALLLATACSNNAATNNEVTTKQTKSESHARRISSRSTLTQASSISTANAEGSHIKAKGLSDADLHWLDGFTGNDGLAGNNGITGNNGLAGNNDFTYPPAAQTPNQNATPQPTGQRTTDQNVTPGASAYPQQAASGDSSQFVKQVLDLVNQERSKAGLRNLTLNDTLSKMALAKAQDMYNNNYFDHQSPTYGSPFDMMKSYGITYNAAGENIAKGQTSAEEVMNQWMNSPGHRANILNSSFTEIGIGYYNEEWVQEFTG